MRKLSFSYFKINFNSYYPHAYVIQNGNFIHYLPKSKKENKTNSINLLEKGTEYKILININKFKITDKNLSTSTNIPFEGNYIKEKVKRLEK